MCPTGFPIRIGTAALTTRGFREEEMRGIARIMADVLEAPEDGSVAERASGETAEMSKRFPLYPDLQ